MMKSKLNWATIGAVILVLVIGVVIFSVQMNQDNALVGEAYKFGKGIPQPKVPSVPKGVALSPEICDNNIDDNFNGKIDCAEEECAGFVSINNKNQDTICGFKKSSKGMHGEYGYGSETPEYELGGQVRLTCGSSSFPYNTRIQIGRVKYADDYTLVLPYSAGNLGGKKTCELDSATEYLCYKNGKYSTIAESDYDLIPQKLGKNGLSFRNGGSVTVDNDNAWWIYNGKVMWVKEFKCSGSHHISGGNISWSPLTCGPKYPDYVPPIVVSETWDMIWKN